MAIPREQLQQLCAHQYQLAPAGKRRSSGIRTSMTSTRPSGTPRVVPDKSASQANVSADWTRRRAHGSAAAVAKAAASRPARSTRDGSMVSLGAAAVVVVPKSSEGTRESTERSRGAGQPASCRGARVRRENGAPVERAGKSCTGRPWVSVQPIADHNGAEEVGALPTASAQKRSWRECGELGGA